MNREVVNTGRQRELDWAKSFAIIAMISIHVYEQISVIDVETPPADAFRIIMEFFAGPLAAPLFMFCMGIGIIYSRNNEPGQMVKRGFHLLKNGYLLSFFKGTLPSLIAVALGFAIPWTLPESFFLVSILQFAGMAFFAIALMKKMKLPLPAMLVVSLVLSVLGGRLSQLDLRDSWTQFLFGLFFETNDVTTFPLFRWLYYPVLGMIFGYVLQRIKNKNKFYCHMFPAALLTLLLLSEVIPMAGIDLRTMFMLAGRVYYKQSLLHHLYITVVILTAMPLCHLISVKVTEKHVNAVVSYLGKNLDVIYLTQWMVICYAQSFMTMFGAPWVTAPFIVPVGILVLVVSVGIIELIHAVKVKFKKSKASQNAEETAA